MKAAVVHEFGTPLVIEDVPTPVPEPGAGAGERRGIRVCATPTSTPRTATGR